MAEKKPEEKTPKDKTQRKEGRTTEVVKLDAGDREHVSEFGQDQPQRTKALDAAPIEKRPRKGDGDEKKSQSQPERTPPLKPPPKPQNKPTGGEGSDSGSSSKEK